MALNTDLDRLTFLLEAEAELALFGDEQLSAQAAEEQRRYVTNYIGSKQKLIDFIWENTPDDTRAVADLFSGSSVVGFMYKQKGKAVAANDKLRYCYYIARAIIENPGQTVTDDEIAALLADNPQAGDFVRKNFAGIYFSAGVHAIIDCIRANIDKLSAEGFKRDIALFALGKTCITGKGGFGHFGTTVLHDNHMDSPERFKQRFADNVHTINSLAFDNGQPCRATCGDIMAVGPQVKADLAYFDPPYATHFSQTNYERSYHFVEGLMTYWDGKEIVEGSKTKIYRIEKSGMTKANAANFFRDFLSACAHIPNWIISYRDQAYPSEPEVKRIIADLGRDVSLKSKDHHYQISAKHGDASNAKEHLFLCSAKDAAQGMDEAADLLEEFGMSALGECDLDLLSAFAAEDKVRVSPYMGSKYFALDWIWKNSPQDAKSMLDAFSGGGNVAYFFKRKGLTVYANDRMHYPWHIARAVVENQADTVSDEEINALLADNPDAGDFCEKTFSGYYFTPEILHFLDNTWANAQKLAGYKKDIALFAMGYACMTKARFGEFGRSKKGMTGKPEDESKRDTSLGEIPLEDFRDLFVKNVRKINGLVFDSGVACQAFRGEIREILPKLDVDLVYADPPYITEFGANDYEGKMHFVEGLMTMWAGKQIRDNARRDYESGTKYNKDTIAALIGDVVDKSRAKSILMSYRDKAFPREPEVVDMLKKRFGQVAVKRMDVRYNIARYGAPGGGADAQELLFVASGPLAAQASAHANFHTRITGQVITKSLIAQAQTDEGDKRFSFVLTHVGTNKNGDHFTEEECRKAYQTVIGTKIDVAHSQDFRDIVGGVVSSEYVEDGEQSRIECVGELYTGVTEAARQAYALVRKGIIRQVSMECDYAEGECSICGKKVKSKAEYCVHLKNYKGGSYQGKPCFEILHGVVFTGVGLLDKKGADENARIKKVASYQKEKLMADKTKQSKGQDEFLDQEDPGATDPGTEDTTTDSPDTEVKRLRLENKKLKKQLEEAQQRISELETEQAAAARRAKAEMVLKKWEGKGRTFDSDEARTAELNRLSGLTEEAILATEQVIDSLTTPKKEDPKPPLPGDLTKKAEASLKPRMKADAGVDPLVVDDKKPASLEEKLKTGLMANYKANVSQEVA